MLGSVAVSQRVGLVFLAVRASHVAICCHERLDCIARVHRTNTISDTSSPAIPPIVRATRRQTESAASAELRTTCEHSWHSSPAGDAVRSRIRSIFRRSSEKVTLTSVGRSRLRQKGGWRHTFRVMTRSRASFADAILSCAPTRPRPGPPARGLPRPRTTFALGSATDRGSIPFPLQINTVPTVIKLTVLALESTISVQRCLECRNCHKAGTVLMASKEDAEDTSRISGFRYFM